MDALDTLLLHAAKVELPANRPVVMPIYQAAGWTFDDLDQVDAIYSGQQSGSIYGRNGTPNQRALEGLLAQIHGGDAGLLGASGMSILQAVFLALLGQGSRVVASQDLYGSTLNLLNDLARFGVQTQTVDLANPDQVGQALVGAQLLVAETISNPRLRVPDLARLAGQAQQAGAFLIVDNTFASPYHCRPLELGVDLVMESVTKFINGHSDVMLGGLVGKKDLVDRVRSVAVRGGLVSNPLESWLGLRGAETLAVRMARASSNALLLAQLLQSHPAVRQVHYPGLPQHPDHVTAQSVLQKGWGAMLSFELDPDRSLINRLLRNLRHIRMVLSLGGATTTLSHPATSSHRFLSPAERQQLGLHDGFLRMSVGIEDPNDLQTDLDHALAQI